MCQEVNGGSGSLPGGVSITARQMARFGLLLLNKGRWDGKQLLSAEYVAEASRPQVEVSVPPHEPDGWYVKLPGAYGLLFWVNGVCCTGERRWPNAPAGVFAVQGNFNNYCFVIPEWNMVVVRMGTDSRIDNDLYDRFFAKLKEAFVEPAQ